MRGGKQLFTFSALALTSIFCATSIANAQSGRWGNWSRGERIRGSGVMKTETRDLKDFTVIEVSNSTDIDIKIGPQYSVELEADDNLLEYIETEVVKKTLYVESADDVSVSSRHGSVLRITMPSLEGLTISGSSDVRAQTLDSDHLIIEIDGSGDVDLIGKAREVEIDIDGSGDIDARKLSAQEAYVSINGSGDVRMGVNDYLDVRINGSGDVTYYGDPKVRKRIRGSGDLRKRRP